MNKTKIDFITELLVNKKLENSYKERIFNLSANTLKEEQGEIKKIWDAIGKLNKSPVQFPSNIDSTENRLVFDGVTENTSPEGYVFTYNGATGEFLFDIEKTQERLGNKEINNLYITLGKTPKEIDQLSDEDYYIFIGKLNNYILDKVLPILKKEALLQKQEKEEKEPYPPKGKPQSVPLPRPKETTQFLYNFRDADKYLKILTHDFTNPKEPIDLESLIENAKLEFEYAKKQYPNTSSKLIERIQQFAFEKNPEWYIRKSNNKTIFFEGWNSKNFGVWYKDQYEKWKNNPTLRIHPANDTKWNKELIDPFKKSIEIRDGQLHQLVNENVKDVFTEMEIKNLFTIYIGDSLTTAKFYTDVDILGVTINKILSNIKNQADKNNCYEVKIEFTINTESPQNCLKICHLDSSIDKPILNNENFIGGDLGTIIKSLWGICNFFIEAKFNEKGYRKYLLNDKLKEDEELNYLPEGFTYLLYFY